jgi:predicted transcriptional regulator
MSGNMKVQHLGIYFVILHLHDHGEKPTASNIAKFTRVASTQITKIANRLLSLGLVQRTALHASHGRGRQYMYYPIIGLDHLAALTAIFDDAPTKSPSRKA